MTGLRLRNIRHVPPMRCNVLRAQKLGLLSHPKPPRSRRVSACLRTAIRSLPQVSRYSSCWGCSCTRRRGEGGRGDVSRQGAEARRKNIPCLSPPSSFSVCGQCLREQLLAHVKKGQPQLGDHVGKIKEFSFCRRFEEVQRASDGKVAIFGRRVGRADHPLRAGSPSIRRPS